MEQGFAAVLRLVLAAACTLLTTTNKSCSFFLYLSRHLNYELKVLCVFLCDKICVLLSFIEHERTEQPPIGVGRW